MDITKILLKEYSKVYAVDTNIILDNSNNIEQLSEEGQNLIVIPATVLEEIDSKKSGFDEINFQARNFARFLYDAKIDRNQVLNGISLIETSVNKVNFLIIDKEEYKADILKTDRSIRNDSKIIEIVNDFNELYEHSDYTFLSLDVMARTRALGKGLKTEALDLGFEESDIEKDFHLKVNIEFLDRTKSIESQIEGIEGLENYHSSVEFIEENGRHSIFYKTMNSWSELTDKNENRLSVPPINLEQKVLSELILDKNDIVVCSGPAGTGKTLVALSTSMRLIDKNKDLYKRIVYIRKTVIAGNKEDELGFLPGDLTEKMAGYNQPMEDSLKKIATIKKKNQTKEELEERINTLKEKYEIEYLYSGHLRGATLDDGTILIADEIQNWDVPSIRTIFSRAGKNNIILALGSNNQIDSAFLTKNNNALTFLINKCGKDNVSDVRVKGVKLTNVMRSKISEWADIELVQK